MIQSTNEIEKKLKFNHIPVLPSGVSKLFETLTHDSIEFTELAAILERFPSIAARLIAIANSPWSSPVKPVDSLEMACSRLGFDIVRSTSIALAVASPFDASRCPKFRASYLWTTALLAADVTSWLRMESASMQTDLPVVRTAGLLHNLGLLLLVDQMAEEVDMAIQLVEDSEDLSLSDALLYILGFNHHEAGLLLGKAWDFPEPLIEAMAGQVIETDASTSTSTSTGEIATVVGIAVSMIRAQQFNSRPWAIPQTQLQHLQIQPAVASDIFERVGVQLTRVQELADTLFR